MPELIEQQSLQGTFVTLKLDLMIFSLGLNSSRTHWSPYSKQALES